MDFRLLSRWSPVGSADLGRALLRHLEELQPGWLPKRWGHWEPMRNSEPSDEMWEEDVFWRSRDRAMGYVSAQSGSWQPHASVSFDPEGGSVEVAAAVTLLQRLAAELEGAFGYIHELTEEDVAFLWDIEYVSADLDEDESHVVVPSTQLERCIPDLFWGTVLGPPYAELFGTDRLASAPAHLVEEVAPNTFYLQLSERIDDLHEDPGPIDEARVAIKEHLGANAFWNPELGEDHDYDVPSFPSPDIPAERRVDWGQAGL